MSKITLEIAVPTSCRMLEVGGTLIDGDNLLLITGIKGRTSTGITKLEALCFNTDQASSLAAYIRKIK